MIFLVAIVDFKESEIDNWGGGTNVKNINIDSCKKLTSVRLLRSTKY